MEENKSIHELIEEFDFSELSKVQQIQVLKELSEKEYGELRETIKMTVNFFENEPKLFADDLLKPVILKESKFVRLISYSVPLYKVAAAVLLVFSFNFLISIKANNNTIEIAENLNEKEISESLTVVDELLKYTSNNSIKYNKGLARLY